MKDNERTLEVPTDDDENVGDIPKKKIKKKKTKEEREADRKVVFWTLLVVLLVTMFFWLLPKIKDFKLGWPSFKTGEEDSVDDVPIEDGSRKPDKELRNYIEYKL